MRLTKFEHACVRLEQAGTTLVLDPGALSGAEVTLGADAILITHEHFDHFEPKTLLTAAAANPDLAIWAPASVVAKLSGIEELAGRVHTAAHGDALSISGVEVHVYGEWHAPTHLDPVSNVGYRIAGTVFHPGDAFTVPEDSVDTLLLPTTGPWLKSIEILEFAQKVGARQGFSIHDGIVNEIGLVVVDNILNAVSTRTGASFTRLPLTDSTDL